MHKLAVIQVKNGQRAFVMEKLGRLSWIQLHDSQPIDPSQIQVMILAPDAQMMADHRKHIETWIEDIVYILEVIEQDERSST